MLQECTGTFLDWEGRLHPEASWSLRSRFSGKPVQPTLRRIAHTTLALKSTLHPRIWQEKRRRFQLYPHGQLRGADTEWQEIDFARVNLMRNLSRDRMLPFPA